MSERSTDSRHHRADPSRASPISALSQDLPPASDRAASPEPGQPELIARAAEGNAEAFTVLVTSLLPVVHRWSLAFAGDPDEADDVTQEAFVQMHRKLGTFRGDAPLEAWLYRIVRYAAGQRQRRSRRRNQLSSLPAAQPSREVYLTDPGARIDRQQVADTVRAYFERLPSRQREIFDLVDLQGYEPVEVALMTGLKPATVRSNLFKARAAVRAHFIALHPAATELL